MNSALTTHLDVGGASNASGIQLTASQRIGYDSLVPAPDAELAGFYLTVGAEDQRKATNSNSRNS